MPGSVKHPVRTPHDRVVDTRARIEPEVHRTRCSALLQGEAHAILLGRNNLCVLAHLHGIDIEPDGKPHVVAVFGEWLETGNVEPVVGRIRPAGIAEHRRKLVAGSERRFGRRNRIKMLHIAGQSQVNVVAGCKIIFKKYGIIYFISKLTVTLIGELKSN